jgi:hypothetical protein
MKNISSIHLRKQGKRSLCHKIIEMDQHLTDYPEGVSCRVCLAMAIKRNIKLKPKITDTSHIGLA